MSKLEDNQKVQCQECLYWMDKEKITFCKTLSDWRYNNEPVKRRCGTITCELCEYCYICKPQIEEYKKKMRGLRYNDNDHQFNTQKKYLMESFGIDYNIKNT